MSKYTTALIVGILVIVALIVYALQGAPEQGSSGTPTPQASASVGVLPTPSVSVVPTAVRTPMPTPGIIIRETKTYEVTMENNAFTPATLTVRQGDVVIFTNLDSTPHTVTAVNGSFGSEFMLQGVYWQLTTASLKPGVYVYNSPNDAGMKGTLTVTK